MNRQRCFAFVLAAAGVLGVPFAYAQSRDDVTGKNVNQARTSFRDNRDRPDYQGETYSDYYNRFERNRSDRNSDSYAQYRDRLLGRPPANMGPSRPEYGYDRYGERYAREAPDIASQRFDQDMESPYYPREDRGRFDQDEYGGGGYGSRYPRYQSQEPYRGWNYDENRNFYMRNDQGFTAPRGRMYGDPYWNVARYGWPNSATYQGGYNTWRRTEPGRIGQYNPYERYEQPRYLYRSPTARFYNREEYGPAVRFGTQTWKWYHRPGPYGFGQVESAPRGRPFSRRAYGMGGVSNANQPHLTGRGTY